MERETRVRRRRAGTEAGRRLNIADLAAHVGLSKGTVSRALNNYPDISEETRRRVREAAVAHGYSPSTAARWLATGTTMTIGVVREADPAPMSEAFLGEFVGGASEALAERGYDLLFATPVNGESPIASYRRLYEDGRVDGFILYRIESDDARVTWLRAAGAPFVTHGRMREESGYAWLDVDNERAFYEAARHLLGLGHRRIAFVAGPERMNFVRLRRAGYERAMTEAGAPSLVVAGGLSPLTGFAAGRELFAARERPTAVLAITDAAALGVMQAARVAGLQVPRDVSIVGYDGVESAAWAASPLTTMAQRGYEAGRRLAEMLVAVIGGAPPENLQELWQARLIRRASDGPPPGGRDHHQEDATRSQGGKQP